jgi:hypothetical protein
MATVNQVIDICIAYETDPGNPPDGRRVICEERKALMARVQRAQNWNPTRREPERPEIKPVLDEAIRVLRLWGVEVAS